MSIQQPCLNYYKLLTSKNISQQHWIMLTLVSSYLAVLYFSRQTEKYNQNQHAASKLKKKQNKYIMLFLPCTFPLLPEQDRNE